MTDTVFVYLQDTIPITDHELLSQVREFYDSAFKDIKWIIGAGLALAGVIIPLYIYFWQRMTFRQEIIKQTEKFKKGIKQDYEKKISDLEWEHGGVNSFLLAIVNFQSGNTVIALAYYFLWTYHIHSTVFRSKY